MLKTWRLTGTRTCLLSAGTSTPLPPFQHLLPSGWPLDARDLPSLPQCHQQSSRAEFRASSLNPTTYRQQRSFTRAPSVPSKTYASITGCSGHAIVQEPAFTVLLTLPNEAWFRGKALAGKLPTCIAYAAQHSDGARARHRKNQIQVHTNKSVVLPSNDMHPITRSCAGGVLEPRSNFADHCLPGWTRQPPAPGAYKDPHRVRVSLIAAGC